MFEDKIQDVNVFASPKSVGKSTTRSKGKHKHKSMPHPPMDADDDLSDPFNSKDLLRLKQLREEADKKIRDLRQAVSRLEDNSSNDKMKGARRMREDQPPPNPSPTLSNSPRPMRTHQPSNTLLHSHRSHISDLSDATTDAQTLAASVAIIVQEQLDQKLAEHDKILIEHFRSMLAQIGVTEPVESDRKGHNPKTKHAYEDGEASIQNKMKGRGWTPGDESHGMDPNHGHQSHHHHQQTHQQQRQQPQQSHHQQHSNHNQHNSKPQNQQNLRIPHLDIRTEESNSVSTSSHKKLPPLYKRSPGQESDRTDNSTKRSALSDVNSPASGQKSLRLFTDDDSLSKPFVSNLPSLPALVPVPPHRVSPIQHRRDADKEKGDGPKSNRGGGGGGGAKSRAAVAEAESPTSLRHRDRHRAANGNAGGAVPISSEGLRYPQCRSVVYAPSNASELVLASESRTAALHLRYVHGYDGDTGRHGGAVRGKNIVFLRRDVIAYPAAAMVVVLNCVNNEQCFFPGHTEDVTAISCHPDRTICASGQIGKDGRVLVWNSASVVAGQSEDAVVAELLMREGVRGVSGVNFTGDGKFLVALGVDEAHTLVVFDWMAGVAVASAKIGHADVHQMGWNPFLFVPAEHFEEQKVFSPREIQPHKSPDKPSADDTAKRVRGCYTLISCGGKQVKFWVLQQKIARNDQDIVPSSGFNGRKIGVPKRKQQWTISYTLEGTVGNIPKSTVGDCPDFLCFVCVCDSPGGPNGNGNRLPRSRILTGTSTGSIYIWSHLEQERGGGSSGLGWQCRGRLLSVVTDLHDGPILDMDYFGKCHRSGPQGHGNERNGGGTEEEEEWDERLITCSKDGIVSVWGLAGATEPKARAQAQPLEHLAIVSVTTNQDSMVGVPRVLCWDLQGKTVVVGMSGNSILCLEGSGLVTAAAEVDAGQGSEGGAYAPISVRELVRGHLGKARRVAAHPFLALTASVASDRSLRLWSAEHRSQLSSTRLVDRASSICFHPDGSAIAVGNEHGEITVLTCGLLEDASGGAQDGDDYGGHGDYNGISLDAASSTYAQQWRLLFRRNIAAKSGASRLGQPHQGHSSVGSGLSPNSRPVDKKGEVVQVRYSPSGDVLAAACKDNLIHLISFVGSTYGKRVGVCRGHSGFVKNIDFSHDGAVMQSCDAVREILFWDVPSSKSIGAAQAARDLQWASWTSVLGWPVQGVFNSAQGVSQDGDINAVNRSHDGTLLVAATSDTVDSAVKLFRFPCLDKAMPLGLYGGHTSPPLDICFLSSDDVVISAGGNDSCLFQWDVVHL